MFKNIFLNFVFMVSFSLIFMSCSNSESKQFTHDSNEQIVSWDLMKDEKPMTQEDIDIFLKLQAKYYEMNHKLKAEKKGYNNVKPEKKLFYPYGISRIRFYYIAIKLYFCGELYHNSTLPEEDVLGSLPSNLIPTDEDKALFAVNRQAYEEGKELQ